MVQRNEPVENTRRRIVNGLGRELISLRGWLADTGQNARVDMLRGERGTEILSKVTDTLMIELGLGIDTPPTAAASKIRRVAKGVLGLSSKEMAGEE
jgi:hypothetical protein